MGDPARGAGRTGASHPMTANEAVLALLRPKPDLSQLAGEPADVLAAAQTAFDAPDGLGTIASHARLNVGKDTAAASATRPLKILSIAAFSRWNGSTPDSAAASVVAAQLVFPARARALRSRRRPVSSRSWKMAGAAAPGVVRSRSTCRIWF